MTKQNKLKKAYNELEKVVKKQSLPLASIRDIIETIKTLNNNNYSYTLLNDTYIFFKNLNYKVKTISTYYLIEI